MNKETNTRFLTMKLKVKAAYPTSNWAMKVDNMKPAQIQAIYFSLKERGAFDKRKKEEKRRDIFQLTIEDCFPEIGVIEVRCIPDHSEEGDVRKALEDIVNDFETQVHNYHIAPDKYVKPDWIFVTGLFEDKIGGRVKL